MSMSDTVLKTLFSYFKLYAGFTLNDYYYFVPMKPSTIVVCCVSIAMQRIPLCLFNRSDRIYFFSLTSSDAKIDFNSLDKGQKRLESIVKKLHIQNESICNPTVESGSLFKYTSMSQRIFP